MLTLEVVPERSLGCEQWEFVVGMSLGHFIFIYIWQSISMTIFCDYYSLCILNFKCQLSIVF